MLVIIDYEMGNVGSVFNAFNLLGEEVEISNQFSKLNNAEAIILPGVGAFSDGMKNLRKNGLIEKLNELVIDNKKPYLGICLGLEFLAEKSFEGNEYAGFGWIKGTIKKIEPSESSFKIPHMGWDDTHIVKKGGLFKDIEEPSFYYLHSYFFDVDKNEKEIITSTCNYGGVQITSTVQKDNIYAVQFHPEKSQTTGIKLLKNFLDDIRIDNVKT